MNTYEGGVAELKFFHSSSAEYHVHNACSPVLFYDALMKIPPGAVTIEIAPHALMQAVLRRSLQKTVINVGMMNMKADNELENFIQVTSGQFEP